jgi:hypothetical protein
MFPSLLPLLHSWHRGIMGLILQKQNFRIIVDPSNVIFDGDTVNANAQMPKPGVDHHRNPAVYYGKALLHHWVYIRRIRQQYPDCNLLLYKDDIKATFRRILYHPDIAPDFATMLQHMLCIPVGLIFRIGFSPSFFCNTSKCRALSATPPPSVNSRGKANTRVRHHTYGHACTRTDRADRLGPVQKRKDAVSADGFHMPTGPNHAPRTQPHEETPGARSTAPTAPSGIRPRLPPLHVCGR